MLPNETTFVNDFLAAVLDVAGEKGVAAVRRYAGGVEVKVMASASVNGWLTRAIGFEAATEFYRRVAVLDEGRVIGGMRLLIPLGTDSLRNRISRHVEALLLQGRSVRSIAREVGIGERAVFRNRVRLVALGKLKRLGE